MISPLELRPELYARVLIAGGPHTGKTTLADALAGVYRSVRHTDDLISTAEWSEGSEIVATWMDDAGPWVIEGVSTPRAIRKWMERWDGKPCDLLLWLDEVRAPLDKKGQATMTKAARTVFDQARMAAQRRGVVVVVASRSDTKAVPEPDGEGDDDEDHPDPETVLRRDVEVARWYLALPAVMNRTSVPAPRVDRRAAVAIRGRRIDAKRIPRQAKPVQFETRYRKLLSARARDTHAVLSSALAKALKKTGVDERATRTDDEKAVARQPVPATTIAKLGEQLQLFADKAVLKQIESIVAIDITAVDGITDSLLEAWVGKNLEVVSAMDAKYFEGATNAVVEAVTKGRSTDWLSDELAERYGVSQSRAEFIARDQIGTLNSNITQARQTSLGIEEYDWSTSGDGRVRPEHEERNGKRFRWDAPPEDGHAGEPPLCRCSAIPVL